MYHGNQALAERLLSELKRFDPQQQRWIVRSMMNFRDREAVTTSLNAVLSGKLPVMPGSFLYLFAGNGLKGSRGAILGERFDFVKAHFDEVQKQLSEGMMTDMLPKVGEGLCEARAKSDLKTFFEPRLDKLPGAPRTLAQVLDGIDRCIAVKAAQEPSVATFLQKY